MKAFDHVNARTIKEAVELLEKGGGLAKPMAGGTDLLGILKDRVLPVYPETVINLKTIDDLSYIREGDHGLAIGALTKLSDIAESPVIRKECKALAQAARSVATPQIRNVATIGGNLGQEVRCWYYRYPHQIGGRVMCARKRDLQSPVLPAGAQYEVIGKGCSALIGENRYHSIFGGQKVGQTPCSVDCPAGTDVPAYMSKIREGDLDGAAKLLLEANPIPSVTGRVCPQTCNKRCNRGDYDGAVSIREIERFMGDYILDHAGKLLDVAAPATGKRVAVVGSGPAGLSAAFYLRRSGHEVVVFDRMKEAGGMLAHALPAFRLTQGNVRRVVDAFERMGIIFRLGTEVGKDIGLKEMKKEFDAIFLATGAWVSPKLGLVGEDLAIQGLEFLSRAKQGAVEVSGGKVIVIGGGNVAVDVAVTAMRQGAREVVLVCLESREEMPALEHEIEKAVEEGVRLKPSWGPCRIIVENGTVKGVELVRCADVFDADGNFAPVFDDAVKEEIKADYVVMAVGQRPDVSFIDKGLKLVLARGLLSVDSDSRRTTARGIFGGGDLTSGPATVVEAVAAGRKAASAIDVFLDKRSGKQAKKTGLRGLLAFSGGRLGHTVPVEAPVRAAAQRNLHEEDCAGLLFDAVRLEADRCFNCGCVAVSASDIAPVLVALDATIKTTKRTVSAETFFQSDEAGPGCLAHDELITEIVIPRLPDGAKCDYRKHRVRSSVDFPLVGLARVFKVDKQSGAFEDVRIVLGAVAPWPVRAAAAEEFLKGKVPGEDTAEQAAALAVENAIPLAGNRYKIQIARTLVKRSVMPGVEK